MYSTMGRFFSLYLSFHVKIYEKLNLFDIIKIHYVINEAILIKTVNQLTVLIQIYANEMPHFYLIKLNILIRSH